MTLGLTPRRGLKRSYSTIVDAGGVAVIEISPTSSWSWIVRQVSAELATAPAGTLCALRVNGTFVTALIATGDAGADDPPIPLDVGDRITVEWVGATPGQTATAFVLYDER